MHKLLLQRQALWEGVTADLARAGTHAEEYTTKSKLRTFERVIDLRHNMDAYHWNFASMMRAWMLCILSPIQVCSWPHLQFALQLLCSDLFVCQ